MRVVNVESGQWMWVNVESPLEAVVVAYEQHDNNQYGLTRYPGFANHPKLAVIDKTVKCGNWVAPAKVNRWNQYLYYGCQVYVDHGPCRGYYGKLTKDCASRTPFVDGVGYVPASYLFVLRPGAKRFSSYRKAV